MGVPFVTGLQGNDPKYFLTVATPKAFAVHSGPESLRHKFNVDVDPRDLEDTYLPAFRATITEGKADSIMCVYNAVNGEPGCASNLLLEKYLRGYWKFDGFVTSDCGAITDFYSKTGHHFSPDQSTRRCNRREEGNRHRLRNRLLRACRCRPSEPDQRV